MREVFGVIVVAIIGYFLYQELYGTPAPMPLPEINTAKTDKGFTPGLSGDRSMPSSYTDPSYMHPGTRDFTKPKITFRPSVRDTTWSPADAPVQCGPYFLYYHPDYWKKPQPQPVRIITVSKVPPDADIEEIPQLWAFGIRRTHDNSYPIVYKADTIPRERLRPLMMAEVTGVYVGGYACLPYKPLSLTCARQSPWC